MKPDQEEGVQCTFLTEVGRSKEKGALSSDAVALQFDQTTTKRGEETRPGIFRTWDTRTQ